MKLVMCVRQFHLANNLRNPSRLIILGTCWHSGLSIRSTKLLRRWVGDNVPATIGLNFKSFGACSLIYSAFCLFMASFIHLDLCISASP